MPTYITLMHATEKTWADPKDLPKHVQEARDAMDKFGGKLLDWNLTMGQYDAVAKVEFPDDSTAAAFTLAIAASGRQRTETLRAFSEADLKRIVAQIP